MKKYLIIGILLFGVNAFAQTPTPIPYCGPIIFKFLDKPDVRCGKLCWKTGRHIWVWSGCKPLYDHFANPVPTPTPTPVICATGCCKGNGVPTCVCPCPRPTPTACSGTPCDCGLAGWCTTWYPVTDTTICARCNAKQLLELKNKGK